MAQSSGRNDDNRNNESGSTHAEKILDSIIEHIESTDKSLSDGAIEAADLPNDNGRASSPDQNHAGQPEIHSKTPAPCTDLNDIERRAADLASRLGGAGLSYSAGVEKHLDTMNDANRSSDQHGSSTPTAIIHEDDRDVDSHQFGNSHDEEPSAADVSDRENFSGVQQVSAWEQELHGEQSDILTAREIELTAQEVEPVEIDLAHPDEVIPDSRPLVDNRKNTVSENVADKIVAALEEQIDPNPDLLVIETKIEALSHSMNSTEEIHVQSSIENVEAPAVLGSHARNELAEDLEQRVDSLEKHIVKLLDDFSVSEQKLRETVTENIHLETKKNVQSFFDKSDIFAAMRAEMADAAHQRQLQDVRLSDSLDALHDALKAMGERVDLIETVGDAEPQSIEVDVTPVGGIVSSVLGSGARTPDLESDASSLIEEQGVDEKAIHDGEPEPGDDLPTWLSDATQDMHEFNTAVPEQTADVFAAKSDTEAPVAQQSNVEGDSDVMGIPDIAVARREPEAAPDLSSEEQIVPSALEPSFDHGPVMSEEASDHLDCNSQMHDETIDPIEEQAMADENNDFLSSARAAARAANERARISSQETEKKAASARGKLMSSNFIAAARNKETSLEQKTLPEQMKTTAKNSLFSDKVRGPNSLLVFTSLILFGTSALLLYGMSNRNDDDGSVAKLNAVEKITDHQIASPKGNSSPRLPVTEKQQIAPSNNVPTTSNPKAKKNSIGDRSDFEASKAIAKVADLGKNSGANTLSEIDKKIASHSAAIDGKSFSVEYTAAIPNSKGQTHAESLFDQYSSFSTPSGTSPKNGKLPKKSGHMKSLEPAITSVSGLLSSASRGDVQAQYEVARRYGKGIGVKRSPAISVEWYEKSAKAGYAPAIYRLATMYERGTGVAKDYKRAMELYTSAADIGNVKAMHNLAVLYTGGNLGKADYVNAIIWYKKAAQFGVTDSQFNLAIIYQNGLGGALDLEQAYKWYSLAAQAGDNEANEMVKDLREDLTKKQLRKLNKLIANWKVKTPDRNANVVSQYRKAGLQNAVSGKS